MKNEPSKLSQVAAPISTPISSKSFQSLAQNRRVLLNEVERLHKESERLVEGLPSCDSGCCIVRRVTLSEGGAV